MRTLFLIIVTLCLGVAEARADDVIYSYCRARGDDASDITHEFVTEVVQIRVSQRPLFKETVSRAIDGSRFPHYFDVECDASADTLELQQRHQKEWERELFAFTQSRESVAAPEKIAVNLRSPRNATSPYTQSNPSATARLSAARPILTDVSKCAEYVAEGAGGVAVIKNHCRQKIWVTYCYYHPQPETAASRIDCGKATFGGAGPLEEGTDDSVPPGSGALALLFPCPYPSGRLDLGKGIGNVAAVTPASHYRCAQL